MGHRLLCTPNLSSRRQLAAKSCIIVSWKEGHILWQSKRMIIKIDDSTEPQARILEHKKPWDLLHLMFQNSQDIWLIPKITSNLWPLHSRPKPSRKLYTQSRLKESTFSDLHFSKNAFPPKIEHFQLPKNHHQNVHRFCHFLKQTVNKAKICSYM
jgi:hypothetical protein